jgi:hypothetical protein
MSSPQSKVAVGTTSILVSTETAIIVMNESRFGST